MNRRELISAVAAHSGSDPKVVDEVLRGFTDVVLATVAKGDPVVVTGFAKFAKIQTKARMGRNPATGEAIKIKASKKARITPLKGFKDVVLGAAPAPKLSKATPARGAKATKTASTRTAKATTTASSRVPKTGPAKSAARKAPTKASAAKAPSRQTAAKRTTTV